jgi:crotonobetainyl-CoA hydratase
MEAATSVDAARTAAADEPAARLEKVDGVAIITLNRPRALNAVNADLSAAVGAALEELDADDSLSVGIITGAGRAFSAGADLKAVNAGQLVGAPGHDEWGFAGLVQHYIRKPLIAAVNGLAFGGGCEIMLACDLAVLSEDAPIGLPEVKRGLIAGAGGLIHLPRQFPIKLAMESALTGEPISAETALRWGLVNRVVPGGELDVAVDDLLARATRGSRASKAVGKQTLYAQLDRPEAEAYEIALEVMADASQTPGAREWTASFLEKRPAVWTD